MGSFLDHEKPHQTKFKRESLCDSQVCCVNFLFSFASRWTDTREGETMDDRTNSKTVPGSLERAIEIAAVAHAGRIDKGGAPYILHPLRVMLAQSSTETRIAAVLHDVVEDGDCDGWTLDRLRANGFSAEVVEAVDHLTKRKSERDDYMAFVRRAADNPIARRVKLADLADNLDVTRLLAITEDDRDRLNRYLIARRGEPRRHHVRQLADCAPHRT